MRFKLRVLEGALKTPDGRNLQAEIPVPVRRFFIGTAADCHMRCSGNSISPHHCMILVESDRVIVRDDASQGGTFINGARIDTTACLFHGDRLRIGKLEFEVLMPDSPRSDTRPQSPSAIAASENSLENPNPDAARAQRETVVETTETIADLIVDMLCMEDEAERDRRRLDPAALEYHPHSEISANPGRPSGEASEKLKLPAKRPPTSLPPPPPVRGHDTVDAAEQALSRLLETQLKKKPS